MLRYDDPLDQEIVGLIASSFAIGRVTSILGILESILATLGSPRRSVRDRSAAELRSAFDGFVYRFYRIDHLVGLLTAIGRVVRRQGSLERCMGRHLSAAGGDMWVALDGFVSGLRSASEVDVPMLSVPSRGSTCKRLHLYMRWMVRRDAVDPGPWRTISPSGLMVPVDVHMHRLALALGITDRRSADARTCDEITAYFRSIAPDDPVRYDFALTRLGIHPSLTYADLPASAATDSREAARDDFPTP